MDSDLVDSIDDGFESEQVSELLAESYYDLIERQEWSFLRRAINLTSAGQISSPTKFTIPVDVRYVEWVKYNISKESNYEPRQLKYLEPEDFLCHLDRDATDRQLVTVGDSIQFYVTTNRGPEFYTSFDDQDIYMDAFDKSLDTTLISNKVRAYGVVNPALTVQDNFIPDLPEHMVQLLQHELNASAHIYFKQQQSPVDEKKRIVQLAQKRRSESRVKREDYYAVKYGR